MGARACLTHHTLVPKLRENDPAGLMDSGNDAAPSCERLCSIHMRQVAFIEAGIAERRRVIDSHTFRDEETRLPLHAPAIVGRHIVTGNSARRKAAGHRRHHHPILEGDTANLQRLKQRCDQRVHSFPQAPPFAAAISAWYGAWASRPPSTHSVCPVMNAASSDARNTTAAAISDGLPKRGV